MKIRWWELVLGPLSALLALGYVVDRNPVPLAVTAGLCIWISWRVLRRYPVALLFARRAGRRWRLGPRAVLNTVLLGLRLDRLFTPELSAKRLTHGQDWSGWGYGLYVPIVDEAAAAQDTLRRLSFYETSDTLALAQPLRSLRDLAGKLDEIDASLVRSSGGAVQGTLRLELGPSGIRGQNWLAAKAAQSGLEATLARRSGADGEWFRRLIAKRSELLSALHEGYTEMTRIREKSVWMLERDRERISSRDVSEIDVAAARDDLRASVQLIAALTEGVGEIHSPPQPAEARQTVT